MKRTYSNILKTINRMEKNTSKFQLILDVFFKNSLKKNANVTAKNH